MPYKPNNDLKLYYSIKEVADQFGVNESLLRYWEQEFPQLKPHKSPKGNRQYTKDDIEEIRLIYHLVKEKGLTLEGAKKKIADNKSDVIDKLGLINRLKCIKKEILDIKKELD
jgi:DNA-binding transcriptional MerR regulator